jgi:hypothetical protein
MFIKLSNTAKLAKRCELLDIPCSQSSSSLAFDSSISVLEKGKRAIKEALVFLLYVTLNEILYS